MSAYDPYGRVDAVRYGTGRYDGYSPDPVIVPTDETDPPEPTDIDYEDDFDMRPVTTLQLPDVAS